MFSENLVESTPLAALATIGTANVSNSPFYEQTQVLVGETSSSLLANELLTTAAPPSLWDEGTLLVASLLPPSQIGTFVVEDSGQVDVDFLFDSSSRRGELGLYSLTGMDALSLGSTEYIQEAAQRALSNSTQGRILISDRDEGARLSGQLNERDYNRGEYPGVRSVSMNPGDPVGFIFAPRTSLEDVYRRPQSRTRAPFFSVTDGNPEKAVLLAEVTPGVFAWEDKLPSRSSNSRDFNDLIFSVAGLSGAATPIGEVIAPDQDWRSLPLGQKIIASALNNPGPLDTSSPTVTAQLVSDTGINSTDGITSIATISGSAVDAGGVAEVKAGFDDMPDTEWKSISLDSNGNFSLNPTQLNEIYGKPLEDGLHTFKVRATDQAGNTSVVRTVDFSLDANKPVLEVYNFVGSSITLTEESRMQGIAADFGSGLTSFSYQVGNQQAISLNIPSSRMRRFDEPINLGNVDSGIQELRIAATDVAGNTNSRSYTVDVQKGSSVITPPEITFTVGSNSGENSNNKATNSLDISGSVSDKSIIQKIQIGILGVPEESWIDITGSIDSNGTFNVSQSVIEDLLRATASEGKQTIEFVITDINGKEYRQKREVTLDTKQPLISPHLANDTGKSSIDFITNDASLDISAFDENGIEKIRIKNAVSGWVDIQGVSYDEPFIIDPSAYLNLMDGEQIISLLAIDKAGNKSKVVNTAITLDTEKPKIKTINLFEDMPLHVNTTVKGRAADTTSDVATISFSINNGDFTNLSLSLTANGEFESSILPNLNALPLGPHKLRVKIADLAGNESIKTYTTHRYKVHSGDLFANTFDSNNVDFSQKYNVIAGNGNIEFGQEKFDTLDLSQYFLSEVKIGLAGTEIQSIKSIKSGRGGVIFEEGAGELGKRLLDIIELPNGNKILFEGLERIQFKDTPFKLYITPNDPLFPEQWNLHMVGVHQAWRFSQGNQSIKIAVLDDGLGALLGPIHGDLRETSRPYGISKSYSVHGTAVQGIIGATTNNDKGISGINWNTEILHVDVIGEEESRNVPAFQAIEGILKQEKGKKVIFNLSLGNSLSKLTGPINAFAIRRIAELVQENSENALFIAASGNENVSQLEHPALLAANNDNVIAVGGVWGKKAQHSILKYPGEFFVTPGTRYIYDATQMGDNKNRGANYGNGLTLMAPVEVYTTSWREAFPSFIHDFGDTSSATPHITGIASLMWSARPKLTASQIKDILSLSAYKVSHALNSNNKWNALEYGSGIVNADAALRRAMAIE